MFRYSLLSLFVIVPTTIAQQVPVTVQIGNTQVLGSSTDGVDSFLGIQYAQVGERFSRSTLLDPEDEPMWNATVFGPNCHQSYPGLPDFILNPREEDEECLYLNIWRPAGRSTNTPLTTMVWIHGGGLAIGSGSEEVTDGANLARDQDVMVVSLNYRLGALGFLPESGGTLNGLRDQIVALEWVQAYIASFGGDASDITLFGESAGGESICMLSVSPLAKGLFQRAIMESGECINNYWNGGVPREDLGYGAEVVNALLNVTGASSISDLSDPALFPAAELNVIATQVGWPVVLIDEEVLPQHPRELYQDPNNIVPSDILVGSNSQEGVYFMGGTPEMYQGMAAGIQDWAAGLLGEADGKAASDAYSADLYNGDQLAAFNQFNGDYNIRCPTREFASRAAKQVTGKVYLYNFAHFSYTDPIVHFGLLEVVDTTSRSWASHMAEIPFVFGNLEAWNPEGQDDSLRAGEDDYLLSAEIQARWAAFAKTGNPNVPNSPVWEEVPSDTSPPTSATNIPVLVFQDGEIQMQSVPEKVAQCSTFPFAVSANADLVPSPSPSDEDSSGSGIVIPDSPKLSGPGDDSSNSVGTLGANLLGCILAMLVFVVM
jgi:para-nitrobenzyl esterase